MVYNFTIKEIENPDKNCAECLTTAFKYMVIDENANAWFGSDDLTVAEDYIKNYTQTSNNILEESTNLLPGV